MIRYLAAFFVFIGLGIVFTSADASALGLKIAPLEYKTTLKQDEVKQGFIDVSNPSSQAVNVRTSVQTFRQIDDDGGLQFFDDEQIASGIKLEVQTFELGPREAFRIFFTIDGKALPEGDVYAAIFFTTDPKQPRNGVGQLVKVGSILSIVNKTPGERKAIVTGISLPFIQLSTTVSGTYDIKNTGREGSGFYPTVNVTSWPSNQSKKLESSLVFGGRQRSNDFKYDTGFGIHRVEVVFGDSKKGQWVVTIAPWMLVLILLVIVVVGVELLLLKRRRKSSKKRPHKNTSLTPEK